MKYDGKDEKWLCKKCIKLKFAEKHTEDCSKCTSLKKDEVSLQIQKYNYVNWQILLLRLSSQSQSQIAAIAVGKNSGISIKINSMDENGFTGREMNFARSVLVSKRKITQSQR